MASYNGGLGWSPPWRPRAGGGSGRRSASVAESFLYTFIQKRGQKLRIRVKLYKVKYLRL